MGKTSVTRTSFPAATISVYDLTGSVMGTQTVRMAQMKKIAHPKENVATTSSSARLWTCVFPNTGCAMETVTAVMAPTKEMTCQELSAMGDISSSSMPIQTATTSMLVLLHRLNKNQ